MAPQLNCFYSLLGHEALLHIAGPDAAGFLQGQTTCDTRKLSPEVALPGAYCTPQGRVVCDFMVCQTAPEQLALRMRRDILATSAATFGKYIIFSKADLDASGEGWQIFGCWGESARETVEQIFGASPQAQYGTVSGNGFVVLQLDTLGTCFECYLSEAHGSELEAQLRAAAHPAPEEQWQASQIASGIARIEAATSEQFIPQMLNYDLTGHIAFDKGCYTGQEVVARLHYRGKAKRRLYSVSLPDSEASAEVPAAGTALFGKGGSQSVGNIVNACRAGDDVVALAVATTTAVETGLHLGAADGPALLVGSLPYSLATD